MGVHLILITTLRGSTAGTKTGRMSEFPKMIQLSVSQTGLEPRPQSLPYFYSALNTFIHPYMPEMSLSFLWISGPFSFVTASHFARPPNTVK